MQPSLTGGQFPALQELILSCNGLTAAALAALTRWVGQGVWQLVCAYVCCANGTCRIMSDVALLTSLDLSGNQLGPQCALLVLTAVRAPHLQRLRLCATGASSPLGGLLSGLRELRDRVQRPHSPSPLQLLDLSHNHINSSDRVALLAAWQTLWPEHRAQLDSTHDFSCSIRSRL